VREASQLFSHDLLQDVSVERQVGDNLLQLPILVSQRPELPQLLDAETRELLLPAVERLLADPEAATDLGNFHVDFDFVEGVRDYTSLAAPPDHR
jgi:hypothetical protein